MSAPSLGAQEERILRHLAAEGLDFRDYRPSTLASRLRARMDALGVQDTARYEELLSSDARERARLGDSLLVQVTSFFRDPPVFQALEQRVLPLLIRRARGRRSPLRAWVVGTASGEEAYSLAMILSELCAPVGVPFDVLATDRSAPALAVAREGLYARGALDSVPPRFLRCFDPRGAQLSINHAIREHVRFSEHQLVGHSLSPRAAILASFDLVLCRNLLIYLVPRMRRLAFQRLSEVVLSEGALVLGDAESPPPPGNGFVRFTGVAPALRIYARRGPDVNRAADSTSGAAERA